MNSLKIRLKHRNRCLQHNK